MVETKTRVSRLDGAETKADSRQRAKESQEQKEHPISKDASRRPRRKDPAQPSSPVSCQSQGTLLHRKTGHTPLGHLRWGPILTSHQDCQDVWGLPSGKERQLSDCPSCSSCPWYLSADILCPAHQALLPWLGPCHIQGSASRQYDPLPYG